MSLSSDDYYRLLGIRVDCIPPSHYQVLGLAEFENSQDRIRLAVRELDSKLRAVIQGPDVARAQQMLNQIAAAKICLTDKSLKFSYDETLKAKLTSHDEPLQAPPESSEQTQLEQKQHIQAQADQVGISPVHDSCADQKRGTATGWEKHGLWFKVSLISFLAISVVTFFVIRSNNIAKVSQTESPNSSQADLDQVDPKQVDPNQKNIESSRSSVLSETRKDVGNSKKERAEPKNDNSKSKAKQRAFSVDVSSLPVTNGLTFWLDADDEDSVQQDEQGTVFDWIEKMRKDRSVFRTTYPKRQATESKRSVVHFDGEVGICFNRFVAFAPKEFTIVFIASGTGILLAKGDPHLEPNASFSIDNKSEVRIRAASRKYLSIPESQSDQFIPRAITISQTGIQLFEAGEKKAKRDWAVSLNNKHAISVGMQQSDDLSRVKKNLFKGDIGEILIFDRALTNAETSEMMNYLGAKWQ